MRSAPDSLATSIRNSRRATVAVIIVALWIGGMTMMFRRNANRSESQRLADVALRLQPATFYYTIERDGEQIGGASSALDTTSTSLVSEEYFVGDYPAAKGVERTSARWQTRLTRGFRLTDLSIAVSRPTRPFAINASVEEDSLLFIAPASRNGGHPPARYSFTPPLYTPSLAPIAFMLGGAHIVGRKESISVFDPTTRLVIRPELTIRAESLFTVIDSAVPGTGGAWIVAHRDTVRAWRIDGAPSGVVGWFDADGRLVAANAGALSATRTAFEIAFRNVKAK